MSGKPKTRAKTEESGDSRASPAEKPISLRPLKFEAALAGLLGTKPKGKDAANVTPSKRVR